MYTISRNHWLVRWAYLFSVERHFGYDLSRKRASLCWLFWRGVICTLLPILFVGTVISALLFVFITDFWTSLTAVGVFATIFGLIFGGGMLVAKFMASNIPYRIENRIDKIEIDKWAVTLAIKSIKSRVCPIIEIREED